MVVLKCPGCKCLFSSKEKLFDHYHANHGTMEGRSCKDVRCPVCTLFWCEWCGIPAQNWQMLEQHKATIHLFERPFACQICRFRGVEEEDLIQHTEEMHDGHIMHPFDQSLGQFLDQFIGTIRSACERQPVQPVQVAAHLPLQCVVASCSFRCAAEEDLIKHAENYHAKPQSPHEEDVIIID